MLTTTALTQSALASHRFGAYTLQAAIAAVHAEAPSAASTDWQQIAALYDRLIRIQPSLVVELNRAVADAMFGHPEKGLAVIDALLARGELANYHLAHTPPGRNCVAGWVGLRRPLLVNEKALALIWQESDRRFLACQAI